MKKQFRPLVLCLTLFCGVMSHSIMGALPPTPIQRAEPLLLKTRFKKLNDLIKLLNIMASMPKPF
jgi:hypothetical protein